MTSLFTFAAPLALLAPVIGLSSSEVASVPVDKANAAADEARKTDAQKKAGSITGSVTGASSDPARQWRRNAVWRQSRIEQRIVIRVSPQRAGNSNDLLSRLPRQSLNARYVERKTDKCLAVEGIAGVQTGSGNRLLLFLRDKKIITINLEKSCRARDFYSGFYIEKNKDGKLCVNRDRLHSRTGVKCEVARMRQLVAVNE